MTGITYKGLHSSQFGLHLHSDNRQVLSDVTRYTTQVPGVPGTIDFGMDTYGEKELTVTLHYAYNASMSVLMEVSEQISGWLYNDGQYHDLIFDDQPQRKYRAKVVSHVDNQPDGTATALQVAFICNPPYAFDLDNNPISPEDVQERLLWDTATLDPAGKQYIQTFGAAGTMRFTVGGAQPVKPKIKLMGYIPDGLTLTCGSQMWEYKAALLYDGILIDCDAQTVTRMSDGENLFSNVDPAKDAYFELLPGQQEIDVAGVGGAWPYDLTVAVEFTPMEM